MLYTRPLSHETPPFLPALRSARLAPIHILTSLGQLAVVTAAIAPGRLEKRFREVFLQGAGGKGTSWVMEQIFETERLGIFARVHRLRGGEDGRHGRHQIVQPTQAQCASASRSLSNWILRSRVREARGGSGDPLPGREYSCIPNDSRFLF